MPVCSVYRAIVAACVVRFACVVQCALQGYVEYNTIHTLCLSHHIHDMLYALSCGGHGCMVCVYCAIVTPVNTCLVIDPVMLQSIVNVCVCVWCIRVYAQFGCG